MNSISEFTPNDLSFHMQYILKFTFFCTEFMFSFQINLLSKTTPKYLYVSTLSTASPLDWFGGIFDSS